MSHWKNLCIKLISSEWCYKFVSIGITTSLGPSAFADHWCAGGAGPPELQHAHSTEKGLLELSDHLASIYHFRIRYLAGRQKKIQHKKFLLSIGEMTKEN